MAKTLNIDTVKASGGFVGGMEKKTVTWKNMKGEEFEADVYVKPFSYANVISGVLESDNAEKAARNIALCICDENGNPIFSYEDITGTSDPDRGALDAGLTFALLNAIGEVNLGKMEAEKSKT
jgi:acetyl-CoA carboxylase carboxyltransferase component